MHTDTTLLLNFITEQYYFLTYADNANDTWLFSVKTKTVRE